MERTTRRKRNRFSSLLFDVTRHIALENITYLRKKNRAIMQCTVSIFTTIVMLLAIQHIRGTDWIDYDEPLSGMDTVFDDDSEQYLTALTRDEEQDIYSPSITGYKYVSGGAGEGRQYLSPNGDIPNRPEIKTDEELPAYCNPPNPCPLGFEADDCDASPMAVFNADYSRFYQSEQKCRCDNDHDRCSTNSVYSIDQSSHSGINGMLKRSRRLRRDAPSKQQTKNDTKNPKHRHSSHQGQTLRFHVAKKSPVILRS